MLLARAIDITSAGAPPSIKKLSNRNKRKETIITNPKEEQRGSYKDQSHGCKTGPSPESTPLMRSPFLLWERRTIAEAGQGFLEEMRIKMREKRVGVFFKRRSRGRRVK